MITKICNTIAIIFISIPFIALALIALLRPANPQVDQKHQWLRQQQSPTGYNCCSEADHSDVDEDIREGEYWVRWDKSVAMHPETGGWMHVPATVVLPGPNKYGPVVWWAYDEESGLRIRCYSRGPLF